jgi:hypothetical protein
MFGFDPLSHNERAEADALHDYLDGLNAGVLAPHDEIDPGLQATVSQVHTSGRQSSPPRGLKTQLWEELMSASSLPAGPIEVPGVRSIDQLSGTGIRSFPRETIRTRVRRQTLWLAAAALILLSVVAGLAYGPGGGGGSGKDGDTASMLAPFASPEISDPLSEMPTKEPLVLTGPVADPAGCTTSALRLNEIDAILDAASRSVLYEGGVQRPVTPGFIDLNSINLPPTEGTPTDDTTASAIEPVFNMYWSCVSAGSTRQQLYLFTPSGIAKQLMNPNGQPMWGNITTLGVPPTPQATEYLSHVPEITAMTTLADGRVVVEFQAFENWDAKSYMVFFQSNGTWFIDDYFCGSCG